MRQVIIGAGAAGIMAAQTIRKNKPDDEITIISEDDVIQSRCMLHLYLSGERSEESLSFIEEDFFDKYRVEWIKGTKVTNLNATERKVEFAGGIKYYDRLLVATGAQNTVYPVKGLRQCSNVFGLRNLNDARAIKAHLANAERVLVIGAGLVGLDAAYAMAALGKKPVIIEKGDTILPRNLDESTALAYQKKFEEAGTSFYLKKNMVGFESDANGFAKLVRLDDGTELECDMIIVATGVRSHLSFLRGSEVEWSQSGIINRHLETNIPDVYVAGDAAGLSGVWPNARKQGEIAGLNMCGIPTDYTDTFSRKNNMNFYGLVTVSMGRLEIEPDDDVVVREDRNLYQKFILKNNVLCGFIMQGDITNAGLWQFIIMHEVDLSEIHKPIWDIGYADFFKMNNKAEYRWMRPKND